MLVPTHEIVLVQYLLQYSREKELNYFSGCNTLTSSGFLAPPLRQSPVNSSKKKPKTMSWFLTDHDVFLVFLK